MAYRRNDMVRRVLSGLLVLIVLMLPVGPAPLALPVFEAASHAALMGHGDKQSGLTVAPVRSHSGSPCDGREHPDGCACCLSCGFVAGNLPAMQTASRPLAAVSLSYLMLAATPPDGLTSTPNLPPPRYIV